MSNQVELRPLKITQNEGNLFLAMRYAVQCQRCKESCFSAEEEDSCDFAIRLHLADWEAYCEEPTSIICPKCRAEKRRFDAMEF